PAVPAARRGTSARPHVFDFAVFGSLFLTLFVIMDPPGITPIFLALTAGRPAKMQRHMAFQAVCVAFGVIVVFGILGQQILDYLHVSVPALMIAGGLLLLLIALDLLTGKTDEPQQTKDVNVALVPLGMPLLAGPGAIVSVILAVQHADSVSTQISVWCAILAMHLVLWATMRYSLVIIRVIKDGGVVLVTRLAGMMLSAIAVQQIINGITQVIKGA
ncbi:multiple antibiotic resistance protein, partial [Streptomyces sp. SolWspMP-sol7th]